MEWLGLEKSGAHFIISLYSNPQRNYWHCESEGGVPSLDGVEASMVEVEWWAGVQSRHATKRFAGRTLFKKAGVLMAIQVLLLVALLR